MPKTDEAAKVEARAAQRADSKSRAYELLRAKPRAERDIAIIIKNEDGDDETLTLTFRAIGTDAYDKLITKYPPTTQQKADGANYNIDEFAPALLARVCPELSREEWAEIWNSEDWSRGETMDLFISAVEINNRGLTAVPPTEQG